MWHVDEGALHAYLDGALEEYPAAEAQRVREHLDVCSACRARLEAERRVRDDAAAILGLASPRVEAPTFEELRAYVRADARNRVAASTRLHRLGWAASLVLAVGAGWMLRGANAGPMSAPIETGPAPAQGVPAAEAAPAVASPLGAQSDVPGPAVPAGRASADSPATRPSETQTVAPADAASRGTAEPLPEAQSVEAIAEPREVLADLRVAAAPPSIGVSVPEVAPAATPLDTVSSLAPGSERGDAVDDTRPERRAVPAPVVTSAQVSAPTAGLVLGRTGGRGDARDEVVADEESYSLVVPGLRVLGVRFRGAGTRPEGQVALQLLESGDTLQVIHLPPDLSPASLEAGPAGTNELVVQRSSGWIVMRAPLADAELMELMTRLLAGR